jgi:glucokinase
MVTGAGELSDRQTLDCADFVSPAAAAEFFLTSRQLDDRPWVACFALASPIEADRVEMTNHIWKFSVEETRRQLELDRLEVINDFAALALAAPTLEGKDRRRLKQGEPRVGSPIAILGPGTGLGVSAAIPHRGDWLPLATEGGHRDLAATNEREWQVVEALQRRFGHVSAERVLSGPGLVALYQAILELAGEETLEVDPSEVPSRARRDPAGPAGEAMALFSGWLGAVAGDLVLTLGARGGVFLAGGIVPRLGEVFDDERFQTRFLAKGRFRSYLEPVPVDLVLSEEAALLGAARHLIGLGNWTTMLEEGK